MLKVSHVYQFCLLVLHLEVDNCRTMKSIQNFTLGHFRTLWDQFSSDNCRIIKSVHDLISMPKIWCWMWVVWAFALLVHFFFFFVSHFSICCSCKNHAVFLILVITISEISVTLFRDRHAWKQKYHCELSQCYSLVSFSGIWFWSHSQIENCIQVIAYESEVGRTNGSEAIGFFNPWPLESKTKGML